MTDEELMVAYVDGDVRAFEALYERHKGRVFGFLMRKLRDRDEAEDVFQMTFAKLHKGRHKYQQNIPFLPWLFTIARNALIDHFRKKGTYEKHVTLSTETVDAYADLPSENSLIEASFTQLSKLNESQRQVLELRFNQGLTFEEISQMMQTSTDNARQIVSRAVRRLRSLMLVRERRDEKS